MTFNELIVFFGTFVAGFIGQDYDGKWNHLYEWNNPTTHQVDHIAFRYTEAIDPSKVRSIKAECSLVYGVDEAASDRSNQWVSYRAHICNAWEITMTDKKVIVVDEELKKKNEKKEEETEGYNFEEEMKKNAEKKKKAAEERRKANKGVLRGYKIK